MTNHTAIRLDARFWSKVNVSGYEQCWPWTAHVDKNGYGRFNLDGKAQSAHRLVLGLKNGDPGLALHRCDNPPCVNPSHLYTGTHQDNTRDKINKGRVRYQSKLTPYQINAIRARGAHSERHSDIAADYDISRSMVSRIIRGERWAERR